MGKYDQDPARGRAQASARFAEQWAKFRQGFDQDRERAWVLDELRKNLSPDPALLRSVREFGIPLPAPDPAVIESLLRPLAPPLKIVRSTPRLPLATPQKKRGRKKGTYVAPGTKAAAAAVHAYLKQCDELPSSPRDLAVKAAGFATELGLEGCDALNEFGPVMQQLAQAMLEAEKIVRAWQSRAAAD